MFILQAFFIFEVLSITIKLKVMVLKRNKWYGQAFFHTTNKISSAKNYTAFI